MERTRSTIVSILYINTEQPTPKMAITGKQDGRYCCEAYINTETHTCTFKFLKKLPKMRVIHILLIENTDEI